MKILLMAATILLIRPAIGLANDCNAACCVCVKSIGQSQGHCENAGIGEDGITDCEDPCSLPMDIDCMNFAKSVAYRPLVADYQTRLVEPSKRNSPKRSQQKSGVVYS